MLCFKPPYRHHRTGAQARKEENKMDLKKNSLVLALAVTAMAAGGCAKKKDNPASTYRQDAVSNVIVDEKVNTEIRPVIPMAERETEKKLIFKETEPETEKIAAVRPDSEKKETETESETETEAALEKYLPVPDYAMGRIRSRENIYENACFDVMLLGDGFLVVDEEKTGKLQDQYEPGRSRYYEEAYAKSPDGIVNITTVAKEEDDAAGQIMEEYLSGCGAENIGMEEEAELAGKSVIRRSAQINGAPTYTYLFEEGGAALLLTVYYRNTQAFSALTSCICSVEKDPGWFEDVWEMGNYSITTPEGFYIDPDRSSSLCADIFSTQADVYLLVYEDADIEEERRADLAAGEGHIVVSCKEDVISTPLGDGICLAMEMQSKDTVYVQYEYLICRGKDVLKYILTLPEASTLDARQILDEMVQSTTFREAETEMDYISDF